MIIGIVLILAIAAVLIFRGCGAVMITVPHALESCHQACDGHMPHRVEVTRDRVICECLTPFGRLP